MDLNLDLLREFIDCLESGDDGAAFWTAYRITDSEEAAKNAIFSDEEYNDEELAQVLQGRLALLEVVSLAEATTEVIPRILGDVFTYLQNYVLSSAEVEYENGETSSESFE